MTTSNHWNGIVLDADDKVTALGDVVLSGNVTTLVAGASVAVSTARRLEEILDPTSSDGGTLVLHRGSLAMFCDVLEKPAELGRVLFGRVRYIEKIENWSTVSISDPPGLERDERDLSDRILKVALLFSGCHEMRHHEKSLFDHLAGTHAVLNRWGCSSVLCQTGLLHSVFGTATFNPTERTTTALSKLQQLAGTHVARLVYLYAFSDRGYHLFEALDSGSLIVSGGGRYNQALEEVSRHEVLSVLVVDCANLLEQGADRGFLKEVVERHRNKRLELPQEIYEDLSDYCLPSR